MAEHNYKFNVAYSCTGCSGAVERVLKKLQEKGNAERDINPGRVVKSYNVNYDAKTAELTTEENLSYAEVLETIKKTGKTVNSGEADGVAQAV